MCLETTKNPVSLRSILGSQGTRHQVAFFLYTCGVSQAPAERNVKYSRVFPAHCWARCHIKAVKYLIFKYHIRKQQQTDNNLDWFNKFIKIENVIINYHGYTGLEVPKTDN